MTRHLRSILGSSYLRDFVERTDVQGQGHIQIRLLLINTIHKHICHEQTSHATHSGIEISHKH